MQGFNDRPELQSLRRVAAPDASLTRETAVRTARLMHVARPRVVGIGGDIRPPGARRWVSGLADGGDAFDAIGSQ
ncbi:hypothetical protein [Salinisphaera sp. LB1]|uniref:hypothetical protein n=1 Tax=Salinisphaera sp. LB1 TaxID=2183911 RepID=UPI000D7D318D|nr:hypothetical protein [Salinisphaera sp. LB1]AWN16435.1 hypothetical protein SALB1_2237 [Salinisphaera sp. LB1]